MNNLTKFASSGAAAAAAAALLTSIVALIYINTKKSKPTTSNNNIINSKSNNKPEKPYYYIHPSIETLVGNTPMVTIRSLSKATGCRILGKCEFMSIGQSSKDRVALSIINDAERKGLIKPNTGCTIFEGTVGSTGISLALISRAKGYNCHIVMPDDQAAEKYSLLSSLGAVIEKVRPCSIVDPNHFVNIAKKRANEMNTALKMKRPSSFSIGETSDSYKYPAGFFCDQFESDANYSAHYNTTGPEIFKQTAGVIDAYVMGAGTGGTLAGVANYLKPKIPNLSVVLADPQGSGLHAKAKFNILFSPEEAEGSRKRHQVDTIVEGMGQNRSTRNIDKLFEKGLIDDSVKVTDQEAVEMSRYIMREDGLFLGSSTAVNLVAAYRVAKALGPGHTIVTILCDSGLRHLTKFWSEEYIEKEGLTPKASSLDF